MKRIISVILIALIVMAMGSVNTFADSTVYDDYFNILKTGFYQNKEMTKADYLAHTDSNENAITVNNYIYFDSFYTDGVLNVSDVQKDGDNLTSFKVTNTESGVVITFYINNGKLEKVNANWYGNTYRDYYAPEYISNLLSNLLNKEFVSNANNRIMLVGFTNDPDSNLLKEFRYVYNDAESSETEFGLSQGNFNFGRGGVLMLDLQNKTITDQSNNEVFTLLEPAPTDVVATYDANGLVLTSADSTWLSNITSIRLRSAGAENPVEFTGNEITKEEGKVSIPCATVVGKEGIVGGTEYKLFVSADGYKLWDVNAKVTIYVYVTITFNPDGGLFPPKGDNEWFESTRIGNPLFNMAPDPEKIGNTFIGWLDPDGNAFTKDTVVNKGMTVTAQWLETEQKANEIPTEGLSADEIEVANALANDKTKVDLQEANDVLSDKITISEAEVSEARAEIGDIKEIKVETFVRMEVLGVTKTEEGITAFKVEITPFYTVTAYPYVGDGKHVIKGETPLPSLSNKEVTMKIYLPISVDEGTPIWVKHKNVVIKTEAKTDGNSSYIEITNTDGFSEFEISLEELYPSVEPSSDDTPSTIRIPKTGVE